MPDLFPFPLKSGYAYTFQGLELAAGPLLFEGLTGFSVSAEVDGEAMVYAQGFVPYARTPGRLKVSGSIKMIIDPATLLLRAEKFQPVLRYQFPAITATLKDGGRKDKITLEMLRLLSFPFDITGTEAIEVDLKYSAFDCKLNGNSLLGDRTLGPSQPGVT